MSGVFIFMILILVVSWIAIWLVTWTVHISMNKDQNVPYDFVTFDTFLDVYKFYGNHPKLNITDYGSIFLYDDYDQILYLHAEIVKINNKCMIFYPISYLKYKMWLHNITKKKSNRIKGLWKTVNPIQK